MRVCLLNTYDTGGGAAIACKRLLHALNRQEPIEADMLVQRGHAVEEHVHSLGTNLWRKGQANMQLVLERLRYKRHHGSSINPFYFSPGWNGIDITSHELIRKADIIHLHWINLGFLSISSIEKLLQTGKPIVWTLHDMWPFTGGCHYSGDCTNYKQGCGQCHFLKKPGSDDLSRQINERKRIFSDIHFVTCSQWLGMEARSSSLLQDADVRSIPNPIDTDTFYPIDKAEARKHLQLDPNVPYILFGAANVADQRKGYDYLLQAMHQLAEKDLEQQPEILLFGKSDESDDDLPFRVHHLGHLGDQKAMAHAYSAADCFVIPSLQDNLPNTVMESLSCGTPVIGFETGGIPEMVDHAVNGYIASYKDAADLAEGIQTVLENSTMPSAARQKVLEQYNEETVGAQYLEVYKSIR